MVKWVLISMVFIGTASATVQSICNLREAAVRSVENANDLDQNVCSLGEAEGDQQVSELARQSHEIIRSVAATVAANTDDITTDPLEDRRVLLSLKAISDRLNARHAPAAFRPQQPGPLNTSLSELITRFGSEDSRRQDKEGYFRALRDVLSKTPTGARVLECFDKTGPRIRRSSVEFPDAQSERSFSATFEPRYDEAANTYDKIITVSPHENPSQMLITLTHELQHACATDENIALQDEYRRLESAHDKATGSRAMNATADALEAQQARMNVRQTIDELRAYQVMPQILSEIAGAHPEYFCQQYAITNLFGTQVMSTGQYASTVEAGIADGSFIHTFISRYMSATFDPGALYQTDEAKGDYRRGPDGKPLFRPEVRAEIEAAGFRVP